MPLVSGHYPACRVFWTYRQVLSSMLRSTCRKHAQITSNSTRKRYFPYELITRASLSSSQDAFSLVIRSRSVFDLYL